MVQGELFIEESRGSNSEPRSSFFSRNQVSFSFDKLLLLLIGILVLFVLAYSFGYERGRKAAERKIEALTAHIDTLAEPAAALPPSQIVPPALNSPVPVVHSAAPLSSGEVQDSAKVEGEDARIEGGTGEEPNVSAMGKYTIQVATVYSKGKAEEEVKKLSNKGFKPFFVQRGRFFEICVGGYETVASAKPILNEFKTKGPYLDAFVRMNPQF